MNLVWKDFLKEVIFFGVLEIEDLNEKWMWGVKMNVDGDVEVFGVLYIIFWYLVCLICLICLLLLVDGIKGVVEVD